MGIGCAPEQIAFDNETMELYFVDGMVVRVVADESSGWFHEDEEEPRDFSMIDPETSIARRAMHLVVLENLLQQRLPIIVTL